MKRFLFLLSALFLISGIAFSLPVEDRDEEKTQEIVSVQSNDLICDQVMVEAADLDQIKRNESLVYSTVKNSTLFVEAENYETDTSPPLVSKTQSASLNKQLRSNLIEYRKARDGLSC